MVSYVINLYIIIQHTLVKESLRHLTTMHNNHQIHSQEHHVILLPGIELYLFFITYNCHQDINFYIDVQFYIFFAAY